MRQLESRVIGGLDDTENYSAMRAACVTELTPSVWVYEFVRPHVQPVTRGGDQLSSQPRTSKITVNRF